MDLTRPAIDVIKARTSRRNYKPRAIAPFVREAVQAFVAGSRRGPFGSKLRFELVAAAVGDSDALKRLGTYGFIKNPPGFIIGAVQSGPRDLEDYGYAMEKIILKATDMGLGTCWLGASFTASEFARKIEVTPNESIPAIASVGYPSDKAGTFERLIQWGVKARKRLPWEELFFNETLSTPLTQEEAGRFANPLEMVRIGPSASNKQPWRFVRENESLFHLYLQRSGGYQRQMKAIKKADLQRVDIGIAMLHFEAACREGGIEGEWIVDAASSIGPLPERTEYVASFQSC